MRHLKNVTNVNKKYFTNTVKIKQMGPSNVTLSVILVVVGLSTVYHLIEVVFLSMKPPMS